MVEMAQPTHIHAAPIAHEMDAPAWFSTREAAEYLGVSARAVRRAIQAGHVPAERQGRGFRISRDALDRYRAAREGGPEPEPRPMLALVPFPDMASLRPSLPAALTLFVGRETEIATLSDLLQREHVRLITLTGPGGVGKTRLSLQLAERLTPSFTDGVAFVPLAAVRDVRLVAAAIAIALDVHGNEDKSPDARLIAHLRGRHLLLVLDNFEHILGAGPLLIDLLTQCPHLTILVSSRAPLRLSGERIVGVPPLALPERAQSPRGDQVWPPLADLARVEAVQLFLDRAEAATGGFTLTDKNAKAVAAICERANGLPLAIELAAARTSLLSPSALLDRLDRQLPLLTGGPRDQPARLQSMREAIAWSYDLLTAEEQAAFRALSVCIGSWAIPVAEALVDSKDRCAALDLVQRLIDQAVLVRGEDAAREPRFSMLETIREFGLEQLAVTGEEHRARDAHGAYFLRLAEWAGPELSGPNQVAFKAILEADIANIRAALDWFVATDDAGSALRLIGAIGWLLSTAPYLQEAQERFAAILGMSGADEHPAALAVALTSAGDVADWQGDFDLGRLRFERALALFRELDDQSRIASVLRALGGNAIDRGEFDQALDLLREGQEIARACGNVWEVGATTNLTATILTARGDVSTALDLHEEAAREWRTLGDRGHVTTALASAAWAALQARELGRAAVAYGETLENARSDEDEWYIVWSVLGAGGIAAARGNDGRGSGAAGVRRPVARGAWRCRCGPTCRQPSIRWSTRCACGSATRHSPPPGTPDSPCRSRPPRNTRKRPLPRSRVTPVWPLAYPSVCLAGSTMSCGSWRKAIRTRRLPPCSSSAPAPSPATWPRSRGNSASNPARPRWSGRSASAWLDLMTTTARDSGATAADDAVRLRSLINGYTWTHVLHAAARLGLADLLANEALTLEELATRTGANPDTLHRLLRGLTTIGVATAEDGERYALTRLGEGLRSDIPGSLAEFALLSGDEYSRAWLGLDPLASDDRTPFERSSGAPFFDWLSAHPEAGQRFNRRMATRVASYVDAAANAVNLDNVATMVDIGGGVGVLLEAFLRRSPTARGVLFDLPEAAAAARARFAETNLATRVDVVGGDFFTGVTAGGDLYLLSQVLHDWDDDQCRVILRNIRRAIAQDGRLVILEAPLPDQITGPHPAVELDLLMMVLTGGRERTIAEYQTLLAAAGFALTDVRPDLAPGGIALLEAAAI